MKEKVQAPELRFPGFTDDWEERKVKDIFKITRGQVLAATETSEEKSDISPFPVYSSQTKNNGLMGYYKDYLFDTAITWTTDGANAGTVSYRSGRFYSTNVNGVLISDKGYTNKAISEILNLEAWKWVSHVGNPKLMNNVMGDISIMIPSSFEEQDRLSDFLNQLDDTIALHQRKIDLLKEQKKGYLQKMFPKNGAKVPELRFAGFADDWEERKLIDVKDNEDRYSYTGGPFGSDLKSSDYTEIGVRIIQLQNIGDGKFVNDYKIYTSEEKARSLNSNLIYPGEIIIAKMADPLARATILPKIEPKYLMASDGIRLKINTDYFDNYYILTLINSDVFRKEALNNSTGTTRKRIGLVTLGNLPMMIPSFEEQQKIGSFFKQLDDTIALHQRKLDLLKEQKKGFLQKMFV